MNISRVSSISYNGKLIIQKNKDLKVTKITKSPILDLADNKTRLEAIKKYMPQGEFDNDTFEIDTDQIRSVAQKYNTCDYSSQVQEITFFAPEVQGYITLESKNFADDVRKAWMRASFGKHFSAHL